MVGLSGRVQTRENPGQDRGVGAAFLQSIASTAVEIDEAPFKLLVFQANERRGAEGVSGVGRPQISRLRVSAAADCVGRGPASAPGWAAVRVFGPRLCIFEGRRRHIQLQSFAGLELSSALRAKTDREVCAASVRVGPFGFSSAVGLPALLVGQVGSVPQA